MPIPKIRGQQVVTPLASDTFGMSKTPPYFSWHLANSQTAARLSASVYGKGPLDSLSQGGIYKQVVQKCTEVCGKKSDIFLGWLMLKKFCSRT